MINFCKKNKKISAAFLAVLLVAFVFLLAPTASANVFKDAGIIVFGTITQIIISIAGFFLTATIKMIIAISKYNDFISEPAIKYAWTIVRDFCNMFFILILLVISFATILRIESYNMKKWLPRLIIMAILINFSLMFCGILIDISQIFFLTFVGQFSNGAEFFNLSGMKDILEVVKEGTSEGYNDKFMESVALMGAQIIFLLVSAIVLLAILVVLLMRVVMFWIYSILSPLAFLLSSFPGGQKYASQYWGEFTKYLINGPVLAFFIWLALSITNGNQGFGKIELGKKMEGASAILDVSSVNLGIFVGQNLLAYLMGIGMLVGGLMVSAQVGGMGASFGNNLLGRVKNKGAGLMKAGAVGAGLWGAKKTWGGVKQTGNIVKATDAKYFKGGGMSKLEAMRSKGGAGSGALGGAALGSLAGPLGTVIGAGIGAIAGAPIGKKFADKWKKKRALNKEVVNADSGKRKQYLDKDGNETDDKNAKWEADKLGRYRNKNRQEGEDEFFKDDNGTIKNMYKGKIKGKDGNDYQAVDNKFYRVNEKGEFVKHNKDNGKDEIVQGDDRNQLEEAKGAFGLGSVKQKSDGGKRFWSDYYASNNKGHTAAMAAENEKIDKEKENYLTMSDEMLRNLLETEKNGAKKMAVSLALGIKNGFKDAKEVQKAKDNLSGNQMLLKKFNEDMNKRNMVMNNTHKDGSLNEAAIAKLISAGKAEWKDQDTKGMTPEAYALMAKQTGDNFAKNLSSMAKTDKDRKNISGKLAKAKDLDFKDYSAEERDEKKYALKSAHAKFTGKYVDSFTDTDKNGNKSFDIKGAKKAFSKMTVEDYGKINEKDLDNSDFQNSFRESINVNTLKKIARSNKISNEKIKKYVEIASKNHKLAEEISNDKELGKII